MKVTDLNGKERTISSIKVIDHDAIDAVTGETVAEKFVEVEIVGRNMDWREWWPFKDFKKLNPNRRPRRK